MDGKSLYQIAADYILKTGRHITRYPHYSEGGTSGFSRHYVHRHKTGCLISAACRIGVLAGKGSAEQLTAAECYAQALGLAFQIRDDMLDVLGDEKTLGKAVHADTNKNTFITLYGVEGSAKRLEEETQTAIDALGAFSDTDFLLSLTESLAKRTT